MASSNWWPILIGVLLIALFSRTYPLAAFTLMLLAISLAAEWWRRRALRGVSFRRLFTYQRGYPGETLSMRLEVENRKFLPLPWLRLLDLMSYDIGPEDDDLMLTTHIPGMGQILALFSLRWYERDRRTFELLLRRRGVFRLGPTTLESGDIFGLFQESRTDEQLDYLTVFPVPLDFETLQLPSANPFGDQKARRRLYEDPTLMMGVREYQPQDEFRRVHWPATARTGSLMVKVYQPVSARLMIVCLNVLTLPHYWEGTDPELLEYLVRVSAAVAEHGLQDGYRVGLVSNTCLSHADQPFRVPPARTPTQYSRLLSALAGVTPFVTQSFDKFLMAEAPRLPFGATLIIVTGLMDDPMAEAILRLRRSGRRVLVLCFSAKAPPPMPRIDVVWRPFARGRA